MKKNLLLLTIFIFSILSNIIAQKCLTEGIKFENQKQIDDFSINYPGCNEIIGDILIESDNSETIINLDSLSQITNIGGYLKIRKNGFLENLNGLQNVNFIGGNLDITLNNSLTNLKGLENLSSINGYLKISYNTSLTNLNGLDNITSVNNSLSIRSNNSLLSFKGLEKLESINGNLGIISNGMIQNLNGINNLISIGKSLSISNNDLLTSLKGLENLTSIGGGVDIYGNHSLVELTELEHIISENDIEKISKNDIEAEISYRNNALKETVISTNNSRVKSKYKFWITSFDKSTDINGYLIEVKDSAIVLSNSMNKSESNIWSKSLKVKNIKTIKYRKNGRIGKGLLIGALTGFATGASIGYIVGKSNGNELTQTIFPPVLFAVGYGSSGAIAEALIGVMIGSAKIKIPINGNNNTFKMQKIKLQRLKV